MLATLLGRPSDVVTKEELKEKLWAGDTIVDFDHSLSTAVNEIPDAARIGVDHSGQPMPPRWKGGQARGPRGIAYWSLTAASSLPTGDLVRTGLANDALVFIVGAKPRADELVLVPHGQGTLGIRDAADDDRVKLQQTVHQL